MSYIATGRSRHSSQFESGILTCMVNRSASYEAFPLFLCAVTRIALGENRGECDQGVIASEQDGLKVSRLAGPRFRLPIG